MNVIVALEQRYEGTPDGKVWTKSTSDYKFWSRYLEVFNTVRVLARINNVEIASPGSVRADGEHVSFIRIPHYIGPYEYLLKSVQIKKKIRQEIHPESAVILRVPGQVANCLESFLKSNGHPYAVEVVGDPYDVFAPGSVKSLLRPFLRWWMSRRLRIQCKTAYAASYVTRETLQAKYICNNYSKNISDVELAGYKGSETVPLINSYSSVKMLERNYSNMARNRCAANDGRIVLIMVGSLEQPYKAPDVLIEAVHKCIKSGLKIELYLVGEGAFRVNLVAQTARLGLSRCVHFLGELPAGEMVRSQLDKSDIFILPSRAEGLPRAMIEAMDRGLPCIGSAVGGIPELLPAEDMVPPGDAKALADKIREIATDPARMRRMSERNMRVAQEYRSDILIKRRSIFYHHVSNFTKQWLAGKGYS